MQELYRLVQWLFVLSLFFLPGFPTFPLPFPSSYKTNSRSLSKVARLYNIQSACSTISSGEGWLPSADRYQRCWAAGRLIRAVACIFSLLSTQRSSILLSLIHERRLVSRPENPITQFRLRSF